MINYSLITMFMHENRMIMYTYKKKYMLYTFFKWLLPVYMTVVLLSFTSYMLNDMETMEMYNYSF